MTYAERAELNAYLQVYTADMLNQPNVTKESVEGLVLKLLKEGPATSGIYLYAGTTEAKNAAADAMRAQLDGWFDQLAWIRPKTENELIYRDAQGYLRINNEQQGLSNIGGPALYGLTGPLGTSIRLAAAADGVLQVGAGARQALNGDLWNAAGNIVVGALAIAGAGIPDVRLPKGSGIVDLPVVNPKPGSTLAKELAVPNLTKRGTLVNVFPNDPAIAQRPVRNLVQDSSGRYWLQTPGGGKITPSGSYDFVTMPDGKVRVSRSNINEDFSTHLGLSGGGEVKYAGSIRFGNNDGPERGKISQWSNSSGHYKPPAFLSGNAGLPEELFNPR